MKESAKAKRLKRHHKRGKAEGKLNLVSLMDIFTILVFFLMVNSGDVTPLNTDKDVKLPVSEADQMPKETIALAVTADDILVGGRPIVSVNDLRAFDGFVEPKLKAELNYLANRATGPVPPEGRPITIVADREIPYELLKKIMTTCVDSGYASISLAVEQKAQKEA